MKLILEAQRCLAVWLTSQQRCVDNLALCPWDDRSLSYSPMLFSCQVQTKRQCDPKFLFNMLKVLCPISAATHLVCVSPCLECYATVILILESVWLFWKQARYRASDMTVNMLIQGHISQSLQGSGVALIHNHDSFFFHLICCTVRMPWGQRFTTTEP